LPFFYPDPPNKGSGKSGRASQDAGRIGQKKKVKKMKEITEVWVEVPGTDGRYMSSNKGHLKQMGKRQRRGKHEVMVFTNKILPIVSDYISGKLGWYVYMDNQKHFLRRDVLMTLFKGIPVELDNSEILDAIKRRRETFRDSPEFKKQNTSTSVSASDSSQDRVITAERQITAETGNISIAPARIGDNVWCDEVRTQAEKNMIPESYVAPAVVTSNASAS
jgi:hypothetical protein